MRIALPVAVLMFVCCAGAKAATPLELYTQGKYSDAEKAGTAQNDASGLAIAARAVLADAMMRGTPCMPCLKKAEDYSRRAIEADPKQPEGHIYLAVALGYEARILGLIAAGSRGYADQAKAQLDTALASDPDNYWALAAEGGWNIEVVRGGGAALARWIYGASIAGGQEDFAKAFRAAPDNIVLRYQYALSLSGYDLAAYRSEVETALDRAVNGKAQSAYETFAQGRAQELREALGKNDNRAYDLLVRRDQGYP